MVPWRPACLGYARNLPKHAQCYLPHRQRDFAVLYHLGRHIMRYHPQSMPQQRKSKNETRETTGIRRRDEGCRARQGHGEMDLGCWARRAVGGIKRRTRGVPDEASGAKMAPASRARLCVSEGMIR